MVNEVNFDTFPQESKRQEQWLSAKEILSFAQTTQASEMASLFAAPYIFYLRILNSYCMRQKTDMTDYR